MRVSHASYTLAAGLALCGAAGCSNTVSAPPAAATGAQRDDAISATDTTPVGKAGSGDFNGWCAKAGETEVIQKSLAEFYADFCDQNGKATGLFTSTLVNIAYNGTGDPRLKYIQALSSDSTANTTTAYFGVGIKLPISAEQHFDVVGPKGGTSDAQAKLAAAQGAHQDAITINPDAGGDKYQARGWTIHSTTSQQTGAIKLVTEAISNNDQYELQKGSLYMYTTVTTQGIQTIKEFSLLTAGVQVNGTGYLLTVAHLVVGDFGLHDLAQAKIVDTAAGLIKSMYQAAADVQGTTGGASTPSASGTGASGGGATSPGVSTSGG